MAANNSLLTVITNHVWHLLGRSIMICVLFFLDYALSFKCNFRTELEFAIHVTCFANESQDGRYNHLGMTAVMY